MQEQWWSTMADEVQGYANHQETKDFSAAFKDMYGPMHTITVPLKSVDGLTLITDKGEIFQRWQQHSSDLLNMLSNITDKALIRVVEHPMCNDNMDTAPSLDEVRTSTGAM
ncbi:unnamed protein product [Caretta caretta]